MNKIELEHECSEHCRSQQHGSEICSAVTLRGQLDDATLAAYLRSHCSNCGQVSDSWGHTALHIAASCGRYHLARWLLSQAGAAVNIRDLESGYTPLHRSIFYGQLHIASLLIQLGANVNAVDYDDLTPLDHAMKDHLEVVNLSIHNPCEVYVWGNNSNFTLGTGNQQNRPMPELLEIFRKQDISIRQVAMHKYHTVFVSHNGNVFSCGHGQGGRLGQGSEQAVLIPQPMKLPDIKDREQCVEAAVGRDHTVLLMENGSVWTCGDNSHHQLGHVPPPSFLLSPRELPNRFCRLPGSSSLRGVCAARFHTVLWGEKGILTCGLHAGQLGHLKSSEATVIQPRLVSPINHKDFEVAVVAVSDGATVVATKKGDVYVLHEYQCRKIPLRQTQLVQVAVVGGHLDARLDRNMLMDKGGEELRVAALNMSGSILIWHESAPQAARCVYMMNRSLVVTYFTMNQNQLLLVTKDGEAFEGEIKLRKGKKVPDNHRSSNSSFHDNLDKELSEYVKVKKLAHIHRAVRITADIKGRNFAVIQVHPKAFLLEVPQVTSTEMKKHMKRLLKNASPEDLIHDVVFQVGSQQFAAHHYILASCSETLSQMVKQEKMNTSQDERVPVVKISNIRPEIFEQILLFIYTSDCDLLRVGECPIRIATLETKENNNHLSYEKGNNVCEKEGVNMNPLSEFQASYEDKQTKKSKHFKRTMQTDNVARLNPIRLAQEAAKKLGVAVLHKLLGEMRFEDGYILARDTVTRPLKHTLKYNHHEDLYDVRIRSEEGRQLQAHKCVLAARLDYFSSMFSHGWLESFSSSTLSLPVAYNILEVLINFLYEDEAPAVSTSEDIDFICNIIALADQLFVTRLMEICEVALANLITLRNVTSLLQIADMFQAKQLKLCCMQYICLNLSAVLESRTLEVANESVLKELSKYYRELNPAINGRVITPFSSAPDEKMVQAIAEAHPLNFLVEQDVDLIDSGTKKILKQNKKKIRLRKSSENKKASERSRNESVSSNVSYNSDEGDSKGINLSLDKLVENCVGDMDADRNIDPESIHSSFVKIDTPWVEMSTCNKTQKILKARMKVLSLQDSITPRQEQQFIKLTPKSCQISEQHQALGQIDTPYTVKAVDAALNPDLKVSDDDFPELNRLTSQYNHNYSAKAPGRTSECKKIVKLSQKQLKKHSEHVSHRKAESITVKAAWRSPESSNSHSFSLVDIMKEEYHQNKQCSSPIPINYQEQPRPQEEAPATTNPWTKPHNLSPNSSNFSDIVANEKKQRDNWTKMRTKSLELTQLEDRAIEDLLVFYNAAESTDERISVHRVITDVATPVWITSHSH